ncbi:MAG: YraN family protein [Synechococcales cyanobacterium RM1_1_8]|nr:YraN family protein [Synechococcales cyanobacterium RM1_1_8]
MARSPAASPEPSPRASPQSSSPGAPNAKAPHLTVGELGENLVADWLTGQAVPILAQRWACQTGELDVVALLPLGFAEAREPVLAFIEVKTRRRGNWDQDGLLAITPQKQNKLWRTARFFLKKHPQYQVLPCRFDVALVRCQAIKRSALAPPVPAVQQLDLSADLDLAPSSSPLALGQAVVRAGYRLTLQEYLANAFVL